MFALSLERNFVLQAKRILCSVPLHKHGYLVSGARRNEACAQALGIIAHECNECLIAYEQSEYIIVCERIEHLIAYPSGT